MTADPAMLAQEASVEVLRFCWLLRPEVTRLDELARTLRALDGVRSVRIQRSDLLPALLLMGLELAEKEVCPLKVYKDRGARYQYPVRLGDAERVLQVAKSYWPSPGRRPGPTYVHGALVRLALEVTETEERGTSALAARMQLLLAPESARPS